MNDNPLPAATVPGPLVLGDFLPYRLSVAAEAVSRLFAERYERRFGLSIPEWRVMAVVGEAGERTTREVIARTAMDRVRVSRAVVRLADKGLLDRAPVPGDARAQRLSLTPAGRRAYEAVVPLARALDAALEEGLAEGERALLWGLLERLGRRAEALSGELSPAPPRS